MVESSSTSQNAQAYQRLLGSAPGGYRLQRLLEATNIGPAFLASHESKQGTFRLRLLMAPPDLSAEDRIVFLGRFQQEAGRLAGLNHMHLQPLVDYGLFQGWPYLVSPYETGKSLSAHLAQHGPFDLLLAGRYLDQVADALEYAHAHAELHLNLSTACIQLREDGNVVVTDMGIARMLAAGEKLASAPSDQFDQDGQVGQAEAFMLRDVKGRLLYAFGPESAPAPEQLLDKPVDASTDVYALGAVLYRMLTGHRVFRGSNAVEFTQQHLNAPTPSLRQWRSDLPPALDQLIAQAMHKEQARRFHQPGELANAYSQLVAPGDTQRKPLMTGAPALAPTPSASNPGWKAPIVPLLPIRAAGQDGSSWQVGVSGLSGGSRISRRRAITLMAGGGAAAIVGVVFFASRYLAGNTAPSAPVANNGQTSAATAPATGKTGTTPSSGHSGIVLARTTDVPINSAKTFPIANNNNNPGLLIHLPNNNFVAFNSTCTHAGCAVNYTPQDHLLLCPCHQAVFDPSKGAAVVSGPAPSPLASIPITVNADGTITTSS